LVRKGKKEKRHHPPAKKNKTGALKKDAKHNKALDREKKRKKTAGFHGKNGETNSKKKKGRINIARCERKKKKKSSFDPAVVSPRAGGKKGKGCFCVQGKDAVLRAEKKKGKRRGVWRSHAKKKGNHPGQASKKTRKAVGPLRGGEKKKKKTRPLAKESLRASGRKKGPGFGRTKKKMHGRGKKKGTPGRKNRQGRRKERARRGILRGEREKKTKAPRSSRRKGRLVGKEEEVHRVGG